VGGELYVVDENVGEKMFMAEQTTINARNEPSAEVE
jgi:hypothetical protein